MNFVLVPFFLAVHVLPNEDGWINGPEYTFDVRVNTTALVHRRFRATLGAGGNSSLSCKLRCQPEEPDGLICRVDDLALTRTTRPSRPPIAPENAEENVGETPPPYVERAPFEIRFHGDGADSYAVVDDGGPSTRLLLNTYRAIANQLSVGVDLRGKGEWFSATESFTVGECPADYEIRRARIEQEAPRSSTEENVTDGGEEEEGSGRRIEEAPRASEDAVVDGDREEESTRRIEVTTQSEDAMVDGDREEESTRRIEEAPKSEDAVADGDEKERRRRRRRRSRTFALTYLTDLRMRDDETTNIVRRRRIADCLSHSHYVLVTKHAHGLVPEDTVARIQTSNTYMLIAKYSFSSVTLNKFDLRDQNEEVDVGSVLEYISLCLECVQPARSKFERLDSATMKTVAADTISPF